MDQTNKTITLNHITKIEGHAKLVLGIDKGVVTTCELSSTEGSRYFEGIVRGRPYYEAHEITSRICGICSSAHVVAAITAIENALGYSPDDQTLLLRDILTLGERIRSHATHLYFLALPDYLGYESALAMAKKFKPELERALRLMKVGNNIIKTLGGRDLHPVSATPGGWLKLPSPQQLQALHDDLISLRADAEETFNLIMGLQVPDFQSKSAWFSLSHPSRYAMLSGSFCSTNSCFEPSRYRNFISEYHESYSTANFVVKEGNPYFVGALARINNNHDRLHKNAVRYLKKSKLPIPSTNPYHNNLAQAIELLHCMEEAIALTSKQRGNHGKQGGNVLHASTLSNTGLHHPTEQPMQNAAQQNLQQQALAQQQVQQHLQPKAGTGIAAIEVPRGTLWHEYTLDDKGIITNANIITPTAQNLLSMQEDIRHFVPQILERPKEEITLSIEKLIRSYDPCFSCSAHFLEIDWVKPE